MITQTMQPAPKAAGWSPRAKARLVAVLAFIEGMTAVWGNLRLPEQFMVLRDPAATAANILSNETLFQLGVTLSLIAVAFHIASLIVFYHLFKPVSPTVALLAAFFGMTCIALQAVSAIFQVAPLVILHSSEYSSAFTVEQLQALAYLALRLQGQTINMNLIFFGVSALLLGYLIFRSGFMPRIIGLLEMVAGTSYLVLLWPPLASALHPYYLFFAIGELVLGLWLLVKGVDNERWHERSHAAFTND
jgi:hypothetical protein